jgi:hypothetical protein
MRTIYALLFSLAFITLVISCEKEASFEPSNPGAPSGVVSGSFKAKINGVQWTANKAAAAARFGGIINISGFSTDKKVLTITLTDSGVHRYILADQTINASAFIDSSETNKFAYTTNQGTYPTQSGGEVNITSINEAKKTISGTFSFKMFREMDNAAKTISEGSFKDISYSTSLPPSSSLDTFRVKIDNSSWVPQSITGYNLGGQIVINATNSTGTKAVGLVVPSNVRPGYYTLDFFGMTYIGSYNPDNNPANSKTAMNGNLQILEHNTTTKRIRGNFSFKAETLLGTDSAMISDGYFSVKYR